MNESESGGEADLQYAMQAYQERYASVSNGINRLIGEIGALREVEEALERHASIKEKGTLVDAGMGFYLEGRAGSSDRIAVSIGAGIIAEKTVEEARDIARQRSDARNSALKRLLEERKELEKAIYELSYRIQGDTG